MVQESTNLNRLAVTRLKARYVELLADTKRKFPDLSITDQRVAAAKSISWNIEIRSIWEKWKEEQTDNIDKFMA